MPREPGFYWYRHSDQHRWHVLEVLQDGAHWWAASDRNVVDSWLALENLDGDWRGPIPKPSD